MVASERQRIDVWRKRMGIEPTVRFGRTTGFEDQEGHQTPFASIDRNSIVRREVQAPVTRPKRRGSDQPGAVARAQPVPDS